MNTNAVGYLRISTVDQIAERIPLEFQIDEIDKYCKHHNLNLLNTFSDEGFTGVKMKARPGVKNAINLACSQQLVLVVYSLSRLARSIKDAIQILNILKGAGADLVCIKESWDSRTSKGKLIFEALEVLGQLDREITSEQTREALANKRNRSEVLGQPPYGMMRGEAVWENEKGKIIYDLTENPKELAIIDMIVQMRDEGTTYHTIANNLNALGLKTRRGSNWRKDRVWQVYQIGLGKKPERV